MITEDIPVLFSLLGVFLLIGFLADIAFKKAGVPDLLVLIGLGVLVGPILGLINPEYVQPFTPLISTLAVAVILFDGGLSFDIKAVVSGSLRAVLLSTSGFTLSVASIGLFCHLALNWRIEESLLLGAILGGTSSAVIIPLVTRVEGIDARIVSILSLESVVTDVLVVVVAMTYARIIANPAATLNPDVILKDVLSSFSVGFVSGTLLGVLWLKVLRLIYREIYRDILTLGVALLLYGLTEKLGGSGAIAAFTFGLLLGNSGSIATLLRISEGVEVDRGMRTFQSQMSFLMRTFLFASFGMIFTFKNPYTLTLGLIISLILLASRYLSVQISMVKAPLILRFKTRMITMMEGRGLAAAAVASLASSYGVAYGDVIQNITIAVILFTVAISSIGISIEKILAGRGV